MSGRHTKAELLNELGSVLVGPAWEPPPPRSPVVIDKPGLYFDVPFADYLNDPCSRPSLNPSVAKTLLSRSPLHAHHEHPRLGGGGVFRESKALDTGTVIHALVLGKGMTGGGQEYVELDFDDYKTAEARRRRDAVRASGRIPILKKHLEGCAEVARRLDDTIPAAAEREVTAVWESTVHVGMAPSGGPVLCRRRIDALVTGEGLVLDLKTCTDAARTSEGRSLVSFGRDMEAAATLDCLDALLPERQGRWRYVYVVAEIEEPYATVEAEVAGSLLELGRRKWRRAVETWARCTGRDEWPGPFGGRLRPEAPPWAIEADLDQQLAGKPADSGGEFFGL